MTLQEDSSTSCSQITSSFVALKYNFKVLIKSQKKLPLFQFTKH